MRGRSEDPNPAVRVLDRGEHVQASPGQGDRLEEVAGRQRAGPGTQEVRPGTRVPLGCRVDPGLLQDLPDCGCRHLHPEHEQLTVQPPIAPTRIFPGRAQYQRSDRVHGAGPASALGRDRAASRPAMRLRCHRSIVSGRTGSRLRQAPFAAGGGAVTPGTPGRSRGTGPSARSAADNRVKTTTPTGGRTSNLPSLRPSATRPGSRPPRVSHAPSARRPARPTTRKVPTGVVSTCSSTASHNRSTTPAHENPAA
jgi:hypothetical protein